MRRLPILTIVSLALAAPAARAAPAVTNGANSGSGSLRAAITGAAPGDTITVPALTVVLTSGQLAISKNLTITGAGARNTTIRTGMTSRIFALTASATLNLSDLRLTEGQANSGGAIDASLASPTAVNLTRVALVGNDGTSSPGGGLNGNDQSTVTLTDSLVAGNMATDGGGIHSSGTLTLTNTTVTGNHSTASGNAAGVTEFAGQLNLLNSTIAGNTTATTDGEGVAVIAGATGNARNSIIANNRQSTGTLSNCDGTFTSQGHNLENASTCGFTGTGDQRDTDPQLLGLANNGGPTDTLAFGLSSPAFDRGQASGCPTDDQRGQRRPLGAACDVGAFELVPPPAVVTGPASAISSTGATLGGTVNPWNVAAGAVFDFGPTAAYGSQAATPGLAAGVGAFDVSATAGGLSPRTVYHYRLAATTSAGAAARADATFTTAALPDPRVTGFRFSPASFRTALPARRSARARRRLAPRGTTIVYVLSETASARISFARKLPGRQVGRRCLRPTRANRRRRSCTRFASAGELVTSSAAGRSRLPFSGRIRGRKLAPGAYRATLVATATGALRPSKRATFSFRVAPG